MNDRDVPVYLSRPEIAFLHIVLGKFGRSQNSDGVLRKCCALDELFQDALNEYNLSVEQSKGRKRLPKLK